MLRKSLVTLLFFTIFSAASANAVDITVDFIKIRKAASNLSWAAATKMALITSLDKPYNWIWQGDMSYEVYNNRNADALNYQLSNADMEQMLISRGVGWTEKMTGVASKNQIFNSLARGNLVIVTRSKKNDITDFWSLIIYGIHDNGNISVWDPQHGWDYTVPYEAFANDSRYRQLSLIHNYW